MLHPRVGRSVCVVAAAAMWAPRASGQVAESDEAGLRGSKRFVFAAIGAVVAGVPTFFAAGESAGGGACTSQGCLTALAVLAGGGAGFLMGLDQDRKLTRELRAGPTLRYRESPVRIPLGLVPQEMVPFRGGAVVTGLAGASLVYPDGRVVSRARGIRGIADAAVLERQGLVVLATGSGLLAFPLSGDTVRGNLLDRGGGSALEAVDSDLAVGDARQIRLLRVGGTVDEPSADPVAAVSSEGRVSDLRWSPFHRVAWALVGDRLVAYAPETLERLGDVTLGAPGLAVRVRGGRAAVAAGAAGVVLVDVADPAAPRVVQVIQGIRFAYAADLEGDRLYVAAGPEGLIVIDISQESAPRVLGVARSARFARDVFTQGGRVWVLDRDGRKVEIAEIAGPEAAGQ